MAQALRKAGRAVRTPPPSRGDDEIGGASVEQILDSSTERTTHSRALEAAIGIRNGLILSAVFWAVLALVYLFLR